MPHEFYEVCGFDRLTVWASVLLIRYSVTDGRNVWMGDAKLTKKMLNKKHTHAQRREAHTPKTSGTSSIARTLKSSVSAKLRRSRNNQLHKRFLRRKKHFCYSLETRHFREIKSLWVTFDGLRVWLVDLNALEMARDRTIFTGIN